MAETLSRALAAQGMRVLCGESLARRTTLRVGGPARWLVEPACEAQVAQALQAARNEGVEVLILGNGSNLLVRDGGFDGLVIAIGPAMSSFAREGDGYVVQAGCPLVRLAQQAQADGLSGLESLSGIPGTVGGAAWMNAGAYGTDMSRLVLQVRALDAQGRACTLRAPALGFGYRRSAMMAQGLTVTEVTLRLQPGDPAEIAESMRACARARREKQPLSLPSAGSFFKRPEGHFAGALIEQAGLKGVSVGGAQVSPLHAGFLVNTGGATARVFLELMALVQRRVLAHSGIMLEAEVRILGCDSSC